MDNSVLGNQLVVMSKADLDAFMKSVAEDRETSSANNLVQRDTGKPSEDAGNDERFITRKEASELLHVDFSTLWRWNKSGLLSALKVGSRKVMYKYSDVLKLINGTI